MSNAFDLIGSDGRLVLRHVSEGLALSEAARIQASTGEKFTVKASDDNEAERSFVEPPASGAPRVSEGDPTPRPKPKAVKKEGESGSKSEAKDDGADKPEGTPKAPARRASSKKSSSSKK